MRTLLICLLAVWSLVSAADEPVDGIARVRILAINDFHGNLQPPEGSAGSLAGQAAGGAAFLATHLERLRADGGRASIFVSAGDLINASPFVSALFDDEPTIEAMNRMELVLNAVGNHEFDDGVTELLRMQNGGCHPVRGCQFGATFGGARFHFLAANVVAANDGHTLFPAYEVVELDGTRLAFIGVTLQGTQYMVNARGIEGWQFRPEAQTVNALVPLLQARGVHAFVLLIHEGGYARGGPDDCPQLSGAIVDIVARLDPAIRVVVSGHTHQAYNCLLADTVLTSAGSYGRAVTTIDLDIDRASGVILGARAANHVVTRDVPKAAGIESLVTAAAQAAAARDRFVGTITGDIMRSGMFAPDLQNGSSGESALGNLVADAELWATQGPEQGNAQIAFMNPGGLRADLAYGTDGRVRYSQLFGVQPFSNTLVTITLTGAQIRTLLEQQFPAEANGQGSVRVLQVSRGLTYTWNASAPAGERVSALALHGVPIDPAQGYRVTVNDFLVNGGDRFAVLKQGSDARVGRVDVEALEAYFQAFSPIQPPALGRIRRLP